MGIIISLLVGALIGWLASLIMKTDAQQGAFANVVIGVIGSFLGNFIFADILQIGGAATAGSFSFAGLFWGVAGAVILIAILKAFRLMGNRS